MSEKLREDFCWVRPLPQYGQISHSVSGRVRVHCTQDTPAEVTKAEWENYLKNLGVLELCEAPQSPKAPEE